MKCLKNFKKRIDSLLESFYDEIIVTTILLYIEIVERTCIVTFESNHGDSVLLFWHENIYSMILLRKYFKKKVSVVVADSNRLHYWIKLLHRLKIDVIMANNPFWIKKIFKDRNHIIILAVDGPFGPGKVPNKNVINALLRFNINAFFVSCHILKKVGIGKNWNKITLPLPFSRVNFESKSFQN